MTYCIIFQGSRDPVFYSVVVVEVTRSAANSGVVRFDVESVLSRTASASSEAGMEETSDSDDCLLVRSGSHQ